MITATAFLAVLFAAQAPGAPCVVPSRPPRSHATFEQLAQEADRARDEEREDDATQLYSQALKLKPEWEEGLWSLSTLLYDKGQYEAARDHLRRFVALRPDAGPGWALLGVSEFQVREYPRSLEHLQHAMASGMGDAVDLKQAVFYSTTVLLTRFEQYDDSMSLLPGIVHSGQCDGPIIDAAGLAGLRMPLLPSEIPADRREMIHLAGQGLCAVQKGENDQAMKSLSALAEAYPREPGVHFLLGSFLMSSHPDEGIQELKREIEISPSHVPARNRLAEQYIKQSQFDLALSLAEKARKLSPVSYSVDITMGEALIGKGDLPGGIRELERAQTLAPDNMRIRWDLLRAYGAAGRTEDAKQEKLEIEKLGRQQQDVKSAAKPE